MTIRSKLRIILIPTTLLFFIGMGAIPYSVYIKNIENLYIREADDSIYWPAQIMAITIIGSLAFFLYRIITRTLIVTIDDELKMITFYYPFKHSKKQYHFTEIKSFSFSSWYSRICDFKRLNFQTEDRIYFFSDYEISNFRVLEKFAIHNFKLSYSKNFEFLNEIEKTKELEKNIQFDIKQAKKYRTSCFMALAGIVALIYMSIFKFSSDREFILWTNILGIFCSVLLIDKILKANRTIQILSE